MNGKVNEHLVKISSGLVSISRGLTIDDDVTIHLSGGVVKIEDRSNQDGTVNRIYVVKGEVAEIVSKGQTIIQNE